MRIYDGTRDIQASPSLRTANLVSVGACTCNRHDLITIRKKGRLDWSFFYCVRGTLVIDGNILIKAGEGWIYPPGVPHHYAIYKAEHPCYHYVHFNGQDMEKLLYDLGIPVQVPIRCDKKISPKLFETLLADARDDTPLSRLRAEYHLLRLFSYLCQPIEKQRPAGLMHRVIDDMEHTFSAPYDSQKYADMLCISTDRFHHLFREAVGISPYAYYLNIRMENARALLEGSQLKIREIAHSCGFDDALYFTQAFKRHTGMTPSAYRKAYEEG